MLTYQLLSLFGRHYYLNLLRPADVVTDPVP